MPRRRKEFSVRNKLWLALETKKVDSFCRIVPEIRAFSLYRLPCHKQEPIKRYYEAARCSYVNDTMQMLDGNQRTLHKIIGDIHTRTPAHHTRCTMHDKI